jgi:hypothetical protein
MILKNRAGEAAQRPTSFFAFFGFEEKSKKRDREPCVGKWQTGF